MNQLAKKNAVAGSVALAALLAAAPAPAQVVTAPATHAAPYRLGAHVEADAGLMMVMKQSAGLAGGVVWGPFRAGVSYATFLSNASFGGAPDGFALRVNYIVGFNASYFIGRRSDDGLYVQAMFHVKQQGITNQATGDHKDLDSLAAGLEIGYVWKVFHCLYVAPRVGALYYVQSPQGRTTRPFRLAIAATTTTATRPGTRTSSRR